MKPSIKWDTYFYKLTLVNAAQSPCLSRQVGALLVRDNVVLSMGYNGPARGIPHCTGECIRRQQGYESGTGLHICTAVHAEANAVINAAREGVRTIGSTLYLSTNCLPCKDCTSLLINAGVVEIVAGSGDDFLFYDDLSRRLYENLTSKIVVRTYVS